MSNKTNKTKTAEMRQIVFKPRHIIDVLAGEKRETRPDGTQVVTPVYHKPLSVFLNVALKDPKLALKRNMVYIALSDPINAWSKTRNDIMEKYASRSEKGEIIRDEKGSPVIPKSVIKDYNREVQELVDMDITIPVTEANLDHWKGAQEIILSYSGDFAYDFEFTNYMEIVKALEEGLK